MTSETIVFLFDVDNTLLDNDLVVKDLERYIETGFGIQSRKRYFAIIEELRAKVGYVDYLGALQRYRLEKACDPRLLSMSSFLVDYPFADRLYPGALDVLRHVQAWGPTVILSDGDVVFQPRKVQRSGLWDAVGGRVLIYVHKERMLTHVRRRYPARHYVMVDDKLRILTSMKQQWGTRLTTVFPRQGHYAENPADTDPYPPADLTVAHVGELRGYDLAAFLKEAQGAGAGPPKRRRRHDAEAGRSSRGKKGTR
jgi:FMN phosphatase YigB (HAD superfamily)